MTSDTRTERSAARPQAGASGAGSKAPQSTAPRLRFTDQEIAEANSKLAEAFNIIGCGGEPLTCPSCKTSERKKVVIKQSGKTGGAYWKCFKCGEWSPAVKLLTDPKYTGSPMEFVQAVNVLLGRDTRKINVTALPTTVVPPSFQAVVDVEVYDAIRAAGSVEAAQWYWATWHIDPAVVADSGSTMLTDPQIARDLVREPVDSAKFAAAFKRHRAAVQAIHEQLIATFGVQRLREAGVIMQLEGRDGTLRDHFLVNADYPVLEVHEAPTGHVVGMQFRPVGRVKAKIDAHKAWKRRWEIEARRRWPGDETKKASDAWTEAHQQDPKAAGVKYEYVTTQLSIRGAGTDSLVGCGLPRIAKLPPGSRVTVVEGFKDVLATRTLGAEAYGMPGTGNMPPPRSCQILEPYDVCVVLDGDGAGDKAREAVVHYLDGTRRHVFGLRVSPAGAARLAQVLVGTATLTELVPAAVVNHRDDGLVWVTGRLADDITPEAVIDVIATTARVPHGRIACEQRGVRSRAVAPWAGRDSADVLVERVAHTGCGCPTCVNWRQVHPADPATCGCAVCKQRRAAHQFDLQCRCGSCHAVRARHATEHLQ